MKGFSGIKFTGVALLSVAFVFVFLAWRHYHRDQEFIDHALRVKASLPPLKSISITKGQRLNMLQFLCIALMGSHVNSTVMCMNSIKVMKPVIL